jgi:hypothetical protein
MPDYSSLTKEFPLATIDITIAAITPGMRFDALRSFARTHAHPDAPGLIRKRFLLMDGERIVHDAFLSLVKREGIDSPIVRKTMLFVWAYRDDRIRRFILERVANQNGKWSVAKLINKANADFFEQWYTGSTKARSNFEYFCDETGIFDKTTNRIHLELGDNWLEDAARVASQHEQNPELRRRLLSNPYKFLVDQNWNALVNATVDELGLLKPEAIYDSDADEDIAIDDVDPRPGKGKTWARNKPKSSDKKSTQALINIVARERANQSHYAIEKALASLITKAGHDPKATESIDLYFETNAGSVLIEVKSCTENNIHAQIRKAVSQVFEYRFLYAKQLVQPVQLAIAIETAPDPLKRWLVKYLEGLNVAVAWLNEKTGQFETTSKVPDILSGIFQSSA